MLKTAGGSPFLTRELLRVLEEKGTVPDRSSAASVSAVTVESVKLDTANRIARLGDDAPTVAQAVAVLGAHASTERIAILCGLQPTRVTASLDALARARILAEDLPPRFLHPILEASVDEEIAPFGRAAMHLRAAELVASGDDPEQAAAHLLLSEPTAESWVVDVLCRAAACAIGRGAPSAAADYLRCALRSNGLGERRPGLLHELGRCLQMIRDEDAITVLQEALGSLEAGHERALAALALSQSLFYRSDLLGSDAVLRRAAAELGDADLDLATQLQTMACYAGFGDPRLHPKVRATLAELARRYEGDTRAMPDELQALLALLAATDGGPAARAPAMLDHLCNHQGRMLASVSSDSTAVAVAVNALVFADALDPAKDVVESMFADAAERGLVLGFVAASAHAALVALRRGDLAAAEADARTALEVAGRHDLAFTVPFTLTYLGEALLERGAPQEAIALLEAAPSPPGFEMTLAGALLRATRGRLRLALGDIRNGSDDLRGAGRALEALSMISPNCTSWRSDLALAIVGDDPGEARSLVDQELATARSAGAPRAVGRALWAAGLIRRGDEAVAMLEQAVALLAGSPAKLEYARSLVDLGGAIRRTGRRTAAREPLTLGLSIAARLGAGPLAERARAELLASGARPRRGTESDRDALTASERRIAELAAAGMSNREIAQRLFLTPKTVENHLGRVYRKLEIDSRGRLAFALRQEDARD